MNIYCAIALLRHRRHFPAHSPLLLRRSPRAYLHPPSFSSAAGRAGMGVTTYCAEASSATTHAPPMQPGLVPQV